MWKDSFNASILDMSIKNRYIDQKIKEFYFRRRYGRICN